MRKILVCVWLLLFASLLVAQDDKAKTAAQAKPDLSGNWMLDQSKSDFGVREFGPLGKAEVTMVIALSDPEFRVARTMKLNGKERANERLFYTDGRGETNPGMLGGRDIKTKTKWSGNKISAKASFSQTSMGDDSNMTVEERWELSKDGKTLTNTYSRSGSNGTEVIKMVYNRAP
jgi:hypothetical protein